MIQCSGTLLVFSKPCHRWLFCSRASDAVGGQRGSTVALACKSTWTNLCKSSWINLCKSSWINLDQPGSTLQIKLDQPFKSTWINLDNPLSQCGLTFQVKLDQPLGNSCQATSRAHKMLNILKPGEWWTELTDVWLKCISIKDTPNKMKMEIEKVHWKWRQTCEKWM